MQDHLPPTEESPRAVKCPQCGANLVPGQSETSVCQYCGSSIIWRQASRAGGPPTRQAVRGYKLNIIRCTDNEANGMQVFQMLAPVGWKIQGGVRWNLENTGMPATISFFIGNPQGPEAFEILPNLNLVWNPGALFNAPGSHSFGAEIQQPVPVLQAFRKFVLPRYRSQAKNLSIIHDEVLPDLPKAVKSEAAISPIGYAEGGKCRVGYQWNNFEYEEEFYGVVEVFRTPIVTGFGRSELLVWFIDYLFSFRAAAGKLDSMADLFTVMIRSIESNPEWYAMFKTVTQQLAQGQINRIHHLGRIGEMYAQAGAQMRAENLQGWYDRQAVYDRLSTDWSRTIRGVDGFYDPHRQQVVELPSGYGHAWANDLGEYIITEDPLYNPNEDSNQHWESMTPQ